MKTTKFLLAILVTFISLFMLACADDADDGQEFPGGIDTKLLPIKISGVTNNWERIFQYDTFNRLTDISLYSKVGGKRVLSSEQKIIYNDQGQIANVLDRIKYDNGPQSHTSSIKYDGLKIRVEGDFNTTDIDVDKDGRILKMQQYSIYAYSDITSEDYLDYTYQYDAEGNIIEKTRNYTNGSYYTDNYSYDKNKGIYSSINTPQWFLVLYLSENMLTNNFIKSQPEIADFVNVGINNVSYTYNSNGYPVKYVIPLAGFCGTPPFPESNFAVEYKMAE